MGEISEVVSVPAKDQMNVFGQFDSNIKKLEQQLQVSISDRNGEVRISGSETLVRQAKAVLAYLTELSMRGNVIQEQSVDYAITMSMEENEDILLEIEPPSMGPSLAPQGRITSQYAAAGVFKNMVAKTT